MRVTIKDVAEKVGLSKATVSLVLNRKETRISEETRLLVINTAEEMGYRPNKVALSLSKNNTKTVGLIIPDIRNSFFSDIAKGFEDEAYRFGYNVFFCTSDNNTERELQHIQALLDWGVDGIALDMAADFKYKGKKTFSLLEKSSVPIVLVDRNVGINRYVSVMIDNDIGAYEATSLLTKLGHRKIGCIAGALWLDCDTQRLNGYKRALADVGIPYDASLVKEASYQFSSGEAICRTLLDSNVSAIFAFNDLMAYGAMNALESMGLKVPQDISIVGFDDIFIPLARNNLLTSVVQPAYEMGRKSFSCLMDVINRHDATISSHIFKPQLILRESVAQFKNNQ